MKGFLAGNFFEVDTEVEDVIVKIEVETPNFTEEEISSIIIRIRISSSDRINRTIEIYYPSFFRRSKEEVISEIRFTINKNEEGGSTARGPHLNGKDSKRTDRLR